MLAEGSTHNRGHLKGRLFAEGLKERRCEACGQDEVWRGRRMALILDHINGVPTDNRLANLRVLCPNCAATLDTHCGRKNRTPNEQRSCRRCERRFWPNAPNQRYCSRDCGQRAKRPYAARPKTRRAKRPSYGRLLREIAELGYCAVGRRYGVSDNAIRKWIRLYEREIEALRPVAPAEATS